MKYLIWIILFMGVALRTIEYAENHSLWIDEAVTASRLNNVSLSELFQPKDDHPSKMQGYPIGFLFLEKCIVRLFGDSERSLRLFPFLCSIISVFLFSKVAKNILNPQWALLALAIFAVSRNLIYHSAELKPYSSDVMITLILYLCFIHAVSRPLSFAQRIGVGILIGLTTYFSFPALFIFSGIGIYLILEHVYKKDWQQTAQIGMVVAVGLSVFMIYYFLSLQFVMKDRELMAVWNVNFMPIQEGLFSTVQWLVASFKRVFSKTLQLPGSLAAVTFVVGALALFFKKRDAFRYLVPPIVLVLILSAFKLYPFDGRVITFLLPAAILLVVAGAEVLSQNRVFNNEKILPAVFAIFLLFYPVLFSARQCLEQKGNEEIKYVLQHIKDHKHSNDTIAVYNGALPAFRYYAKRYGLQENPYVLKGAWTQNSFKLAGQLEEVLSSGRVWIIFTHVSFYKERNERLAVLKALDNYGEKMDAAIAKVAPYTAPGEIENNISASAYLYEFAQ